jgi:putative peptidoglycan lipid II flippase
LPLGLVGVAVGIAILPRLSRAARALDDDSSRATMDEGIGLAMVLTLPAAAALMLAPVFLIDAFFVRGAFLADDAFQSGSALFHFAWGVPAFVLIKVLAPAYFAREDTKTPMRYALVSVFINTVLGAGLFFWMKALGQQGFVGLAIATSIAAWVNVALLWATLIRRDWYRPGPRLASGLVRAMLATGIMSVVVWLMMRNLEPIKAHLYDSKALTAVAIVLAGGVTYALAAIITGAVRISDIRRTMRR